MCSFIIIFQIFVLEDTQNVFFRLLRCLRFTHLRLLQCIWNLRSFQFWLSVCSFIFISSSFYCDFLLSLIFFRNGSFSLNLFIYQPPQIACNNDWCFSLGLGGLGSSTNIFWYMFFISKIYILQCSRKCCSKDCSQQLMKFMVVLSETNSSVVEFNGIG